MLLFVVAAFVCGCFVIGPFFRCSSGRLFNFCNNYAEEERGVLLWLSVFCLPSSLYLGQS